MTKKSPEAIMITLFHEEKINLINVSFISDCGFNCIFCDFTFCISEKYQNEISCRNFHLTQHPYDIFHLYFTHRYNVLVILSKIHL